MEEDEEEEEKDGGGQREKGSDKRSGGKGGGRGGGGGANSDSEDEDKDGGVWADNEAEAMLGPGDEAKVCCCCCCLRIINRSDLSIYPCVIDNPSSIARIRGLRSNLCHRENLHINQTPAVPFDSAPCCVGLGPFGRSHGSVNRPISPRSRVCLHESPESLESFLSGPTRCVPLSQRLRSHPWVGGRSVGGWYSVVVTLETGLVIPTLGGTGCVCGWTYFVFLGRTCCWTHTEQQLLSS